MMRILLTVILAVHCGLAIKVTIEYTPPVLRFVLPVTKTYVGAAKFHYFIKTEAHLATAVHTGHGWEYSTTDALLDGVDTVRVYAVIYDKQGKPHLTTDLSSLTIGEFIPNIRLPPRRLRGVAYFRDDFSSFNQANWDTEVSMYGGGNGEFQVYTNDPKNIFTRGGNLYLYPTLTVDDPRFNDNFLHNGTMDMTKLFGYCSEPSFNGCTRHGTDGLLPPIMSGKVKSIPTMKYGIVEVRALVPKGNWLWPALWMRPKYSIYGPTARSGEIDIMEYYDYKPHSVETTIHWGLSWKENGFLKSYGKVDAANWHDSFHTWKVEWTPDHIVVFLDDKQVVNVDPGNGGFWQYGGFNGTNIWQEGSKMAPFDQPFYFIMNVAVGGTTGAFPDGDDYGDIKKPWTDNSTKAAEEFWNARNQWLPSWQGDNVAMLVDYVEFRNL